MALLCLLGLLVMAGEARAAAPGVSISMISAPQLTLDSNKPCQEGPRAAYVAFRVTNTSGAALTNLRAVISGFANGITLGGLPSRPQAAEQYIGSLAAGANRVLYWFVAYPCTFGNTANLVVTITDNTAGSTQGGGTVTTFSMVSAQAGGVLMNGTLGPGAVVGQVIEFDVAYEFGGVSAGDSYNLQVAGNQAFDAGCFQLVRMQIVVSGVTSTPSASVGTNDTPYFSATSNQGGSKIPLTVRYYFKYLCADVASTARPYGNQFSGGQLKYSSNYESFVGPTLPGATEPFDVTKLASPDYPATGGTITYTVTITNPSPYTASVDSIVDVLPAGVSYQGLGAGSGVTLANSGSLPATNATGRIVFRGSPAYTLPLNGSLTLVYTAKANQAGRHVNLAEARTGRTLLGTAADTVIAGSADLRVVKVGPDSIATSETITYVVTTTNLGPDSAMEVVVRDSLPAGVTFLSASRGGTLAGGVITWPTMPWLANGASLVDTVRVSAPASLDTLVNRARAASPMHDSSAVNNDGTGEQSRKKTHVLAAIQVTPDGLPQPDVKLPGKGYSQPYVVRHRGSSTATYDLVVHARGAEPFLVIDSIRGAGVALPATDSVRLPLGPWTTGTYTVWYSIPMADSAALNVATLLARSTASAVLADSGWAEIRRVVPALTLGKTVDPTGVLAPGTDLTYAMQFANAGDYEATQVQVTDQVPAEVLFKLNSASQLLPGGLTATVQYSADPADTPLNAATTWTYVPGVTACAAAGVPPGYDGCVRRIRWTLSGPLSVDGTGTVGFVARIR